MLLQNSEQSTRTTEVWFFFVIVLVLNAVFVASVANDWLPEVLFRQGRFLLLGGVLAFAVVVFRGFPAIWDLVRPLMVWRISPLWFVVAALWPFLFAAVFLFGRSLWTGEPMSNFSPNFDALTRPRLLINMLIAALVGEIVWVGYALKNLGRVYGFLLAVLITGTVWTLWWLPMSIFEIGIIPNLSMLGLWLAMIGVTFFCLFFYTLTQSGLVILVMQFCFNSTAIAFPIMPNSGGQTAFQVYAALYALTGFLFVTVLLPRLSNAQNNAP